MRTSTKIPRCGLTPQPANLCGVLLILLASQALAASDYADQMRDFSLALSHNELALASGNNRYPVELSQVTVSMLETDNDDVDFGLQLGNSYASLGNDNPSAGLSLNGYHLGLSAGTQLGNNPRLALQALAQYHYLSDSTATTTVKLDWFEWQFSASLRLALAPSWGLRLGAAYSGVDAQRRVTGSVYHTLAMDLADPLHGLLALEKLFPNGGRASITLLGGGRRGASLAFARRF